MGNLAYTRVALGVVAGAALVGLASPAGAAPPNLVRNPSFERPALASGYVVYPAGSTAITGWRVGSARSGGGGSVEQDASNEWVADSGRTSVDLAGNAPGSLSQKVPTVPGQTYVIGYAMGGNFLCAPRVKRLVVLVDGKVVQSASFNDTHSSRQDMHWAAHDVEVVATATSTKLEFEDTTAGSSSCGPALDSVSMELAPPASLPEAPSVALLGGLAVALAAGGYALSRRRHRHPV